LAVLSLSYAQGTVPQVSVQLETAHGWKRIVGDVDSGSERSLCPLMFVKDLGLAPSDLAKAVKRGESAIGDIFDTWSARGVAINGQIVLPDSDEGDFVPWGPLFTMDLVFAETDTLLLGQSDFFASFDVKFLNRDNESVLEICECPKAFRGP
jgi:hypothetical protein